MNQALVKFVTDRGFTINDSLSSAITTWKSWYNGKVDGFHSYTVYNGTKQITRQRASLQLGKSICEQIANLLFNEKCGIAIEDTATDEFIKGIFDENNVYVKLNEAQERKASCGTMCYIPYFTTRGIRINYIPAENLLPLTWENGVIKELAVYSPSTAGGDEYLFVQLFTVEADGTYKIENLLLKEGVNSESYTEIDMSTVPGYENIEAVILTKTDTKPFIIDRLNIANNIDPTNPLGLAVFANAVDSMRFCDTVYDSYLNEFELGKKRVMVSSEAVNIMNGQPVFDPNDLVYYQLPEGMKADEKPFIHELNMTLRTADHQAALQQVLNIFSSQCGLGENFYKYDQGSIATATQVISENNTLFRTLKKHEIILEAVLVDLVRLIIELANRHVLASGLQVDSEITVTFDDSIIEDKNTELARRLQEVTAGLLRPEIYLAYRYGVTEEQAREMMPSLPQMLDEGTP